MGEAERFADYAQWETWLEQNKETAATAELPAEASKPSPAPAAKKKLSYLEAREFAGMEQRIAEAEDTLQQKRATAEDPAIASDAARLLDAHAELDQARQEVDTLYERWAELERKQ